MGLFLRDDNGRSRLQTKIASDLEERLKERQDIEAPEVESNYTQDSHETRTAGIVIAVLLFVFLAAVFIWALNLGGIL